MFGLYFALTFRSYLSGKDLQKYPRSCRGSGSHAGAAEPGKERGARRRRAFPRGAWEQSKPRRLHPHAACGRSLPKGEGFNSATFTSICDPPVAPAEGAEASHRELFRGKSVAKVVNADREDSHKHH